MNGTWTIPRGAKVPRRWGGGEQAQIELYALFTDEILAVTEATKASYKLSYEYTLKGKRETGEYTESMRVYDRNAMTWDDDRRVAAFVTARDPAVLQFSKNVVSWTKGKASPALNANLCTAMALHEALRLSGMAYVVDPKTPFAAFSASSGAVDFLQFPRQTLVYKAGDCDDLSILYNALLESVGIETAFVTVPGHIFVAFCLGIPAAEARKSFVTADELVYEEGSAWVPVEVTMTQSPFLDAWQRGAKEWRESAAREGAAFHPTHAAWADYGPVGLPGSVGELQMPRSADIIDAYVETLASFVDREVTPEASRLQEQIRSSQNDPRLVNKLGVLYARYGLLDKAIEKFSSIGGGYTPALVNLGNTHLLRGSMAEALSSYALAYQREPGNAAALLGLARTNYEMGNRTEVRELYATLQALKPELASQFAYLQPEGEEASRAADATSTRATPVWDEE